ncbi:PQQ-like beta-propeller repeat protein [Streptomyces sp. FIT100]|uniref:PQQ-like beta-propeller repeat protein n=1 Tax=Streptomyces sp. FIT100 TaxID=2837956 RepID=UPI0021CA6841|nr:PQQ-like beta-propeller repeat protein [Streptomyces sp. FIT100]UUN27342.1 PQQ-binding-like beta-propeller repeat protein [Streptomyces sp. FIT100]
MTQPPSQQPPQGGGFGSPQDPQQVPQPPQQPAQPPSAAQPQPQPGYGYPQQAPGPYGQPGPYNQQPGPYNSPGPYGPQPGPYGYGYPTQPQYPGAPAPAPAPGGGNPFKGRPGVIVGAAVAALLVIGAGTWFAVSGGEDDAKPDAKRSTGPQPTGSASVDQGDGSGDGRAVDDDLNAGRKPGEAKVLFLTKNDIDLPRNGAETYGPWAVGDTVVKGMYKELVGYSATDGKKKWTIPFPAELCAAAPMATADGKLVVGFKDGTTDKADCTQLQMIDATTGKAGWKKTIKQRGTWDFLSDITLSLSGDTVTAARTGNADAFRVSDGKELFGKLPGNCQPRAFAGGAKLIAAETCPSGDIDKLQEQVQELDPATGAAKWTYKLNEGWQVDSVYSVSPVVLSLTHADDKKWAVVALNANGTVRSQMDGGKDNFEARCGQGGGVFSDALEGCVGVAADATTFYMATAPDASGSSRTNAVVAFDLDTGKQKWRAEAPDGRTMTPLRMEGANVLLYVEPSFDAGGAVATLAPAGGKPNVILQHPASTAEIESTFWSPQMVYQDGRFYIASGRVSSRNDEEEKQTKTMMAFGK